MKRKAKFKLNKKQIGSLGGVAALLVVLAGGGYYLSQKEEPQTPEAKQQEEIQQNLENKEKQIEQNNAESSKTPNSTTTTPTPTETTTLTSLASASITAMKDGTTVYLSVYGIGAGKYEVEKDGVVVLTATDYSGHGGLALPNLSGSTAKYQVFQVVNGKRTASSKIIEVTSAFTGTKEFIGA